MKKVFLLLSAFSIVAISSCSDDDSPGTPADTSSDILVKRMVYDRDDDHYFEIDYTYDGNKLVQGVFDDGVIEKYYYEGDLINKVEYINAGEVEERFFFTYNTDGKLIEYHSQHLSDGEWYDSENYTYVYNNDNTITKHYGFNAFSTLHIENGEIAQKVHSDGTTYTYTYDNKNSPFKNVTGYAEIAEAFSGDHELEGRSRNIVSIINETHDQNYTMTTFQYNA
nr:hypothetical protein [Flavobacterium sp.]